MDNTQNQHEFISCQDYTKQRKQDMKNLISGFESIPHLAIVQVDDNFASSKYIKWKKKDCDDVGIVWEYIHIKSNETSQREFEYVLKGLNATSYIHGIIIQLPIPDKYNLDKLQNCIDPIKDVDGFRKDSYFKPCTAQGIVDWIKFNNYSLRGKTVAVLNRSKIVGKPLIDMFINEDATVICCNSHTPNIQEIVRDSDVVVTATGKPHMINRDWFRYPYTTELLIDVGINYDEETGKTCGDVLYDSVKDLYGCYVTPVPGGVGLLTRLALLNNLIRAYYIQNDWNTHI